MKRETEKKIAAGLLFGLFIWLVIGIPPTAWLLRQWAQIWTPYEGPISAAQVFGCISLLFIWILTIAVLAKEPEKKP